MRTGQAKSEQLVGDSVCTSLGWSCGSDDTACTASLVGMIFLLNILKTTFEAKGSLLY